MMIFLLQRRSRRAPGRASLPSCGLKPSVSSRHTLWRQNKCQITTDAVQVHAILSATSATLLLAASCKGDFQLTTRATPHGCKPWCFGLQQHLKKQPLTLLLHLDLRCAGGASVMSVVCSKQNTVSHADSLHKALQSQTAPGNISCICSAPQQVTSGAKPKAKKAAAVTPAAASKASGSTRKVPDLPASKAEPAAAKPATAKKVQWCRMQ